MDSVGKQIFDSEVFRDAILPEVNRFIKRRAPAAAFMTFCAGLSMQDPRVNIFVTWLFLRDWDEVLAEAQQHGLDAASLAVWKTPDAYSWFDRSQKMYDTQMRAQEEAQAAAEAPQEAAPPADRHGQETAPPPAPSAPAEPAAPAPGA